MQGTTVRALLEESDDGLTMVAPTFVPWKRPDVLDLDLEDGLILYDPEPSLVHHLNSSAAEIWRRCDGRTSVATIVADLARRYAVSREQMGKQVRLAIGRLESLGLVKQASVESAQAPAAERKRRKRP